MTCWGEESGWRTLWVDKILQSFLLQDDMKGNGAQDDPNTLRYRDRHMGSDFADPISPLTVRMQVVVEPSLVCSVEMT